MDLYSRKIISWDISKNLTVEGVINTVKKSKTERNMSKALVIHSDRGSQYTSSEYYAPTSEITRSYSRK